MCINPIRPIRDYERFIHSYPKALPQRGKSILCPGCGTENQDSLLGKWYEWSVHVINLREETHFKTD